MQEAVGREVVDERPAAAAALVRLHGHLVARPRQPAVEVAVLNRDDRVAVELDDLDALVAHSLGLAPQYWPSTMRSPVASITSGLDRRRAWSTSALTTALRAQANSPLARVSRGQATYTRIRPSWTWSEASSQSPHIRSAGRRSRGLAAWANSTNAASARIRSPLHAQGRVESDEGCTAGVASVVAPSSCRRGSSARSGSASRWNDLLVTNRTFQRPDLAVGDQTATPPDVAGVPVALDQGWVMRATSSASSSCASVRTPFSTKPISTTTSRIVFSSASAFLATLAAFS